MTLGGVVMCRRYSLRQGGALNNTAESARLARISHKLAARLRLIAKNAGKETEGFAPLGPILRLRKLRKDGAAAADIQHIIWEAEVDVAKLRAEAQRLNGVWRARCYQGRPETNVRARKREDA